MNSRWARCLVLGGMFALLGSVTGCPDPDAIGKTVPVIGRVTIDDRALESGAVKPDPADFAVSALFEELRSEFASLAASKDLALQVAQCADVVHSDRSLVEQILKNLLSNAIKYTRRGSVALRCLHEKPKWVRIEVVDTGIGIPPDQLRYIYDEFYQGGVPTNSTREGYGLGLSIVQRLVSLLGLQLDVHSDLGKGSVFALTLPKGRGAVAAPLRTEAELAVREPKGQVGVLLVEDDASVRDATQMLLRSEGYRVTAVASLAEALEQASKHPSLDLLVTDYHLRDGETGMQVITAVREALGVSLAAVLITGDSSSAMHELPADPRLRVAIKPLKAEEFLSILAALLSS